MDLTEQVKQVDDRVTELTNRHEMQGNVIDNIIYGMERLEALMVSYKEAISKVEAENTKLRAEFESMRNRWLALERRMK